MRNRGPDPGDFQAFAPKVLPVLTEAVNDYSFLLGRGYGTRSALQLVGNRYRLNKRQRLAVRRVSATDGEVAERKVRMVAPEALRGQPLLLDGFNQLIILESLFSGAFVFLGRDGAYRDLAGVHGSYKRVAHTEAALQAIGKALLALKVAQCTWVLDRPVSNSGRLRQRILDVGLEHGYDWTVDVVFNPDRHLIQSGSVVTSSDSEVLDGAAAWFNLLAYLVENAPHEEAAARRIVAL